jgi:hypothetical protein
MDRAKPQTEQRHAVATWPCVLLGVFVFAVAAGYAANSSVKLSPMSVAPSVSPIVNRPVEPPAPLPAAITADLVSRTSVWTAGWVSVRASSVGRRVRVTAPGSLKALELNGEVSTRTRRR